MVDRRILGALALASLIVLQGPGFADPEPGTSTIHLSGFVLDYSHGVLLVGKAQVYSDAHTACFERTALNSHQLSVDCPTLMTVGTYVHVSGTSEGGKINATQIIQWPASFLSRLDDSASGGPAGGNFIGGAFLQEFPARTGTLIGTHTAAASKVIWINGIRLTINKGTSIVFHPDGFKSVKLFLGADSGAFIPPKSGGPVKDAEAILVPNTYISYSASGRLGEVAHAFRIDLYPNSPTQRERRFLNETAAEPSFARGDHDIPRSIRLPNGTSVAVVQSAAVQAFVRRIGESLIPPYQRALASGDPTRIAYRFYVVKPFRHGRLKGLEDIDGQIQDRCGLLSPENPVVVPKANRTVREVVGLTNGMVLIPDESLASIANEAEFAFLVSSAIEAITQKESYFMAARFKASVSNEFSCRAAIAQTKRILRMGIREELLAGYDVREAPFAWAAERGISITNPVIAKGSEAPKSQAEGSYYHGRGRFVSLVWSLCFCLHTQLLFRDEFCES